MNSIKKKIKDRLRRHKRVRAKVEGTAAAPRVAVFRSAQHVYAQAVDDQVGQTLLSVNDLKLKEPNKIKSSLRVGEMLGGELKKKGINRIVFDRGGFKYHGRVKALADGLRSVGIQF